MQPIPFPSKGEVQGYSNYNNNNLIVHKKLQRLKSEGEHDPALKTQYSARHYIIVVKVPYDSWNHNDFLWGKDADYLLYGPAMRAMAQFQTIR